MTDTAPSETPLTDAKERESEGCCTSFDGARRHAHYGWKHARSLERSLAQAQADLDAIAMVIERAPWLPIESPDMSEELRAKWTGAIVSIISYLGNERLDAAYASLAPQEDKYGT